MIMKILRALVWPIVLTGGFYLAVSLEFPAPCARPIAYSIGRVDPQFHVSRDTFLKDVQDAEKVWEHESGKQLFTYDSNAQFTVNLVYDQRQQVVDQTNQFTHQLDTLSAQQQSAKNKYDQAYASYTSAKNAYLQDVKDRNKSYDELEQERVAVNKLADTVNGLATKEQQIVSTYNANVQQFNTTYAGQREFDQGEYQGNTITIYEFSKNDDLQLVLEHELGHALGLGHVENPASIMYYMVNPKNLASKELSIQDIGGLTAQCKKTSLEIFWEHLQIAVSKLLHPV